ncbi:MAG: ribbon-helix-helix domain-containing protein [Phycisphaerae bacterium]
MVRTQIYLTERQQEALDVLAGETGKKRSELIREGIEKVIADSGRKRRRAAFAAAAGMWKDRDDLPDFAAMRAEADRW